MLPINWVMQSYFSWKGFAKTPRASRNPAPNLLQRQIGSIVVCSLGKFGAFKLRAAPARPRFWIFFWATAPAPKGRGPPTFLRELIRVPSSGAE